MLEIGVCASDFRRNLFLYIFTMFPDLFVSAHEFIMEANVQRNRNLDNAVNSNLNLATAD